MKFYIYKHTRPDTNEIFYIGKGNTLKKSHEERYKASSGRNKFWKAIVAKNNGIFIPEILCYCDSESLINELERYYIKLYGRRSCGEGTLCNMTDGGDGSIGLNVSLETRIKLSKKFSGKNHPNYGKKLSKETCLKKSESMKISEKSLKGKKLPEWWREKIRKSKYGELNPMFGRTGEKHRNSKKIIDTSTNKIYSSISEAAESNNIKMKCLSNMLRGHRPNRTTLKYVEYE